MGIIPVEGIVYHRSEAALIWTCIEGVYVCIIPVEGIVYHRSEAALIWTCIEGVYVCIIPVEGIVYHRSEAALIWTCTEGGRIVLRAVHQSRAEQHRNTHFIQYSVQVPNFILVQY